MARKCGALSQAGFTYKNWTGPVEEAGGGVLFSTEQMLIDHMISNELVPTELFKDSSIFKVKRGTPRKPKQTTGRVSVDKIGN